MTYMNYFIFFYKVLHCNLLVHLPDDYFEIKSNITITNCTTYLTHVLSFEDGIILRNMFYSPCACQRGSILLPIQFGPIEGAE